MEAAGIACRPERQFGSGGLPVCATPSALLMRIERYWSTRFSDVQRSALA